MTEPKRWSSPGSEVDPVLRAVMRYGRELGPSSEQLGKLISSTAPRREAAPTRRHPPRARWSIAAVAAVFVAGGALAGYAARSTPGPERTRISPSATPPAAPRTLAPAGRTRPALSVAPPVTAPTSAPAARPQPSAPVASPPPTSSALDAARDALMLQEARGFVVSSPARALTLTRDHELHFPTSPLSEERSALRIEALVRLGRRRDAELELAAFTLRFPRSIYARRLQALLAP